MSRTLTPATRLNTLRKQAKRWLKSLRAGDAEARTRLQLALGAVPEPPGLRDVQLGLAREYGLPGWTALKAAVEDLAQSRLSRAAKLDLVLRNGWGGDLAAARKILERDPGLAKADLAAACACADLEEVERRLARDPEAAGLRLPPLDWAPLLYLAYSRLPGQASPDTLAIATLLLDQGADPNASFDDGWGNPFTALCGVIGQGEGVKPAHPHAEALAELLLDRGAEPFDTQALYNTSIVGDDTSWIARLYARSASRGETVRWNDPDWKPRLGGRVHVGAMDYLLGNAVGQNHLARAAWLLEHGANPDAPHAYTGRPMHAQAQLDGFAEMLALLERHGAKPVKLAGPEGFQAACLRMDEAAARRMLADDPALIEDGRPLIHAGYLGRADVVALLLSLGADVNARAEDGATALHRAVQSGSLPAVRTLVEAAADIDVREGRYRGTPFSWSLVLGKPEVFAYLAPLSRDVRPLVNAAMADRLEQVLAEDPGLANFVLDADDAPTPLFCLPDDEAAAAAMAAQLLRRGADPRVRNAAGRTPAEQALLRGLDEAAEVIERWGES